MIITVIVQPSEYPTLVDMLGLSVYTVTSTRAIYLLLAGEEWFWNGFDYYPNIAETRKHLPVFTFDQFCSFPNSPTLDYLQSTYPEAFI